MSGNRDYYNRKKSGGSRGTGSSRSTGGPRGNGGSMNPKARKGKSFFKGLMDKVNLDKVRDNLKPVESEGHSDFDEAEYFGGKISPPTQSGARQVPKEKDYRERDRRDRDYRERDYRERRPRSESPSREYTRHTASHRGKTDKTDISAKVRGGFNSVSGEVKKRVKTNRPPKSGSRKKTGFAFLGKIPGFLALLSCLLIVSGVVVALVPGSDTGGAQPTATVESAFPIQTFTYEEGLATMGLEDEAQATNKYMVPLKPKEYDPIIYSYPPAGKRVALTFDDGPSKEMTDDYIKVLADNNVKATFFLLAKNVRAFPDEAKRLAEAGHDVASHSLEHAQLSNLSTTALQNDFKKTNEIFKEVFGETPDYMRPPYGSYDDEVLSTARNYGQIPIYWSIDTNDWRKWSTETMINTIKSEISDGAIILMHEGKCNTLEALPTMISTLRDMGYEIVPLSQLLSY